MAEINSSFTRQPFGTGALHDKNGSVKKSDEKKLMQKNNLEAISDDEFMSSEEENIFGLPTEIERDELASLVTLFRQRREWERKASLSNDSSFDQILEDGDTPEKINQFFRLISHDISDNMKKFFVQLQRFFTDESDMFLVLEALLRRKNLSKQLKAKLKSAIAYLEGTSDAKKLKSGINVALKARRFSSKLALEPSIIRESYREFLEEEADALDLYYNWILQFGYSKREILLEFMESALLTDMMSLDPSCSKSEFGNLLNRLKQLNILHSMETILFENLQKDPLLMQLNSDALSWFQFFYYCVKGPETVHDEMMLLTGSTFKFLSHHERGTILQAIYQLFMTMPIELFVDIEYKERLKNTLNKFSDINVKEHRKAIVKKTIRQ